MSEVLDQGGADQKAQIGRVLDVVRPPRVGSGDGIFSDTDVNPNGGGSVIPDSVINEAVEESVEPSPAPDTGSTEETPDPRTHEREEEETGTTEAPTETTRPEGTPETPDSELQRLRDANRALAEKYAALAEGRPAAQVPVQPTQETVQPVQREVPAPPPPISTEPIRFFETKEDIIKAIQDPEAFNKRFNDAVAAAVQQSTQGMSSLVDSSVQRQTYLSQLVTEFYKKNTDLAPYRRYVQVRMTELASEHPDKAPHELLDMIVPLVRKELSLAEKAQETETARRKPEAGTRARPRAAFAGGTGKQGSREEETGNARSTPQQINNMLAALGK